MTPDEKEIQHFKILLGIIAICIFSYYFWKIWVLEEDTNEILKSIYNQLVIMNGG